MIPVILLRRANFGLYGKYVTLRHPTTASSEILHVHHIYVKNLDSLKIDSSRLQSIEIDKPELRIL